MSEKNNFIKEIEVISNDCSTENSLNLLEASNENEVNQDNDTSESFDEDSESYTNSEDDSEEETAILINLIKHEISKGSSPRSIVNNLLSIVPESEELLWRIVTYALTPLRKRLEDVQTLTDVVYQIKMAKNIIVLTGAGISCNSGIPDFRSKNGLYSTLQKRFPDLKDPQSMFDLKYFSNDPRPFYKFAREIFPGQFQPTLVHKFIKKLEVNGKLLRNYTQNIDTIERIAGITKLIECHGSFEYSKCTKCKHVIKSEVIRDCIFNKQIPVCFYCNPSSESNKKSLDIDEINDPEELASIVDNGVFRPTITFFGEELPEKFYNSIENDLANCDLLIVIGSSLKVRPVAMLPQMLPSNVPQILINREPIHLSQNFDVCLYGDGDVIVQHLSKLLFEAGTEDEDANSKEIEQLPSTSFIRNLSARNYAFPGADVDSPNEQDNDEHSNEINYFEDIPRKKAKIDDETNVVNKI